jgi:hypothetical protein
MSTHALEAVRPTGLPPGAALRAALRDLYAQSWRFFLLNAALSACLVPVAVAGLWSPAVWLLLLAAGPLAAALVHCAVVTAMTGELRLGHALEGLRLYRRRGLLLGALLSSATALGAYAVAFYGGRGVLLLAALAVYLLVALLAFQLVLWPLAVAAPGRPLRVVLEDALRTLLARPLQALVLTVALVLVNLLGVVLAIVPFLTLTIAYSCLAAVHFALPVEEDRWPG